MKVILPNRPFYRRFSENLNQLQTAKGLKRAKMSLTELHMVWLICEALFSGKTAETISKPVAEWFRQQGFSVEPCGVGWRFNLPAGEKEGIQREK